MRVAIIGSRTLNIEDFDAYVPPEATEIVSAGDGGVACGARAYARRRGLPFRNVSSDGTGCVLSEIMARNARLLASADLILAFWDGQTVGTQLAIEQALRQEKKIRIFFVCDS
ncbi:MAG TPA: hypothetical protein DDW30_03955 [Clostridiales bacterium]|nr:hypothetical protein [Clostridiales bacterium]